MTILSIEISDELLKSLQGLAREHSVSLDELVRDVLIEYVDDDEVWDNDPTVEEIKQMVEEAIQDYKDGKLQTVDEVLAELRREIREE